MKNSMLFSEFSLRQVTFKNRIVVSPMWQYSGKDGFASDWHMIHLGRFAAGGAALVMQEGTAIERRGCGTTGDLAIWDDKYIPGLQRLTKAIRDQGAVPGIQLMHCGRKARQRMPHEGRAALEHTDEIKDWDDWEVIAPSAIPLAEGYPVPRAMTVDDIRTVQQAWVDAARRAAAAGYDVLNVHGAHGYLIAQFLSSASNHRNDDYGGSFKNRVRFLLEVLEGIRSVWPDDKPIIVRLSVVDRGWSLDESVELAQILKRMGVDMVDCTSGGLDASPVESVARPDYGYQVPLATHIRQNVELPTMAVGLIVKAQQAEAIIREGSADLVALGREFLYNPNWPIDAAQKLGVDPDFSVAPLLQQHWLRRRAHTVPDFTPSTFTS